MNFLDKFTERATRGLAQRTSRRSLLAGLGGAVVGATTIPLLPVARAAGTDGDNGYDGVARNPPTIRRILATRPVVTTGAIAPLTDFCAPAAAAV